MYKSLARALVPLAVAASCSSDPPAESPVTMLPPAPWLEGATLAAETFGPDFADAAIERMLDKVVLEKATVVVGQSPLTFKYRDEPDFDAELKGIRRVADRAHKRGLRVVWAVPTLIQRVDADEEVGSTIGRDHPDWVQVAVDEERTRETGVLCPVGPGRAWLLDRVKRLIGAGLDGLMLDAPTFVAARGPGDMLCPEYRAKLKAETGVELPKRVDCNDRENNPPGACIPVWNDQAFRTYLRHRHTTLAELEVALAGAAREARSDAITLIRSHALDSNRATEFGNDPSFFKRADGLHHLWDPPTASKLEGMLRARADDWLDRIAMLKYARSVDGDRTMLATSPGDREWDSGLVLATTLAAQASPWEHRAGLPQVSAGVAFRTRAFGWARANLGEIQKGRPAARVAILQSSASRDYVDFGYGAGYFSTFIPPKNGAGGQPYGPDGGWWGIQEGDSSAALEVVGESRGIAKALSHLHVPFEIVPMEGITAAALAPYRLTFAADVVALSDPQAQALREYAQGGGKLLSFGLEAFTLDEVGRARPDIALADVLGYTKASMPLADAESAAAGTHVEALLGRRYLRYEDGPALDRIKTALETSGASMIETNATRDVYLDVRQTDAALHMHVINLTGAGPKDGVMPASVPQVIDIALDVPRNVEKIIAKSPDPGEVDRDIGFDASQPGVVRFQVSVAQYTFLRIQLGGQAQTRAAPPPPAFAATALRENSGMAGHSVEIRGTGFGYARGTVTWGGQPCTVTAWRPSAVSCYLPHTAAPATANIVLTAGANVSAPLPFTVVPGTLSPTPQMVNAMAFITTKMKSKFGGIYTNFKDRVDSAGSNDVYPYGHHQTAEHLGLMLWMSAAMLDHKAYEDAYQFLALRMLSPRRDVVNWAIDKVDGKPMLQRDAPTAPLLNANAPLDDFRVLKGLIAGWMHWKDPRYFWGALRLGAALLVTSVTHAQRLPEYPEGIVAYAYNWPEYAGAGITDGQVIPIDYADLWAMRWLSDYDPRWLPVIDANVRLMKRALLPNGQFYNSYLPDTKELSGDFEYRDNIAGQKVKAIQSLWIAIHLARIGETETAQKALDFYKKLYAERGGIAEYLNYDGSPCTEPYFDTTLKTGEARIHSQAARLAYYLGDNAFGDKMITEKLLPDQVTAPADPRFGFIGKSTTSDDDAEAWNTLESLIAMTIQRGSPVVSGVFPKK